MVDDGSVQEIIRAGGGQASEDFCKYILFCVAQGLSALHKNNVVHRNICSTNILCDSKSKRAKIFDLEKSAFLTGQEPFRTTNIQNVGY